MFQDSGKYRVKNVSDHNIELPMPRYADDVPRDKRLTQTQLQLGTELDKGKVGAVPYEVTLTGAEIKSLLTRPLFAALCSERLAPDGSTRAAVIEIAAGPSRLYTR